MKKYFVFIYLSLLLIPGTASAQASADFNKVVSEMNAHFNSIGKNNADYKHFKRWEWYNSTRLSPDGKIANVQELNTQALLQSTANRETLNGPATANTGIWTSLGPTSVSSDDRGIGRVNRIAFHPTNENTLYLASATGGLWISTDAGSNWYSYSEGIPNMSLSGVCVDFSNPSVLYILTGDADAIFSGANGQFSYGKGSRGVLKSFDGGFTWQFTGLRFIEADEVAAYKMVMHPANSAQLLVATEEGIYRTSDGGITWARQLNNTRVYDIEFHPTNSNIVYASGSTADSIEVYKSTNGGSTFAKTHAIVRRQDADGNNSFNRSALAVTAAATESVYLLTGPCTSSGVFRGFYRSTDAAESFSLRTNTPNILGRSSLGNDTDDQEHYDLAVAADPGNASNIVCGGIYLWRSSNAGSSFFWEDDYSGITNYYHADIHDLSYHPLNANKLYMCGDGGVYISTDKGNNWLSLNNNLQVTQYYKISANPNAVFGTQNIVIGGAQDNGTHKRGSNTSAFNKIYGGDGMDCIIDPDDANTYMVSTQNGNFYYSTDGGSSFSTAATEAGVTNVIGQQVNAAWVTPVAEVAGSDIQFVLGYQPAILATNLGGAFAFTKIGWSGNTFVKTARGNSNRLWVGDNNYLGKNIIATSTNSGSDVTTILNEFNTTRMTDMTFDPNNGSRVWVSYGGYTASKKVRFTSDAGGTWTDFTGSLPNVPVNCIIYDNSPGSNGDAIYIGTDIGVFYRDNTMSDWIPFSNSLPVVEVTDLEIHNSERLIRAGTYGRGIWQSPLYGACPSSISLTPQTVNMYSPYNIQASQSISSTALHGSAGGYVYYRAGNYVDMKPDFQAWAVPDNVINVSIGPCGAGIPDLVNGSVVESIPQRVRGVLRQ